MQNYIDNTYYITIIVKIKVSKEIGSRFCLQDISHAQ